MDNPLLPAYTLHNLANIYIQIEDCDTALDYNHEALTLINNSDDLNAKATILNGIAQIFSKKGLLSESQKVFNQAIEIALIENNLAQAHAGLGYIEYKNNNFYNAQKLLEQALNTFKKPQEQEYVVQCIISLAKINQIQSSKEVLTFLQEAITICELNGFRSLLAKIYELSSRINAKQKNNKKAHSIFNNIR